MDMTGADYQALFGGNVACAGLSSDETGYTSPLVVQGYANQLHEAIGSLNTDINVQLNDLGPALNFNEWVTYFDGNPGYTEDDWSKNWGMDPVPYGWRNYYHDLGIMAQEVKTDETMFQLSQFDNRYRAFYKKFLEANGKASKPLPPSPGYNPPPGGPLNAAVSPLTEAGARLLETVKWVAIAAVAIVFVSKLPSLDRRG